MIKAIDASRARIGSLRSSLANGCAEPYAMRSGTMAWPSVRPGHAIAGSISPDRNNPAEDFLSARQDDSGRFTAVSVSAASMRTRSGNATSLSQRRRNSTSRFATTRPLLDDVGPARGCAEPYRKKARPNRHDTGSTTARSVDEIALIRDTINHYGPVFIASLSIQIRRAGVQKKFQARVRRVRPPAVPSRLAALAPARLG